MNRGSIRLRGVKERLENDCLDLADDSRLTRGRRLYKSGSVESFHLNDYGREAMAAVQGSRAYTYQVMLRLTTTPDYVVNNVMFGCDCPDDARVCKHIVAAVLYWLEHMNDLQMVSTDHRKSKANPNQDRLHEQLNQPAAIDTLIKNWRTHGTHKPSQDFRDIRQCVRDAFKNQ
ncbi:SWIM zinc finger family protein [Tuberibacillus sp. Marseille-P3662]|uniref:SWIM zinc finger family protein n=1 Tax=Tuberibacillus sp. Marseille-P3662 TaxID=1965358 RepID=UPI000A1CE65E|nr:hypothetical protein [Tuberibacillus sp. Marseille-P3662]